jgi:hypothetical protein
LVGDEIGLNLVNVDSRLLQLSACLSTHGGHHRVNREESIVVLNLAIERTHPLFDHRLFEQPPIQMGFELSETGVFLFSAAKKAIIDFVQVVPRGNAFDLTALVCGHTRSGATAPTCMPAREKYPLFTDVYSTPLSIRSWDRFVFRGGRPLSRSKR